MEKKISVLVVDDSAMMRNFIVRILEKSPDIEVSARAMNGIFALKKIEKMDFDVITLDLEMPEMNGTEFLRERKKRDIKIPVIILSSLVKKGARVTMEALSLGASDFVLKPVGSDTHNLSNVSADLINLIHIYGRRHQRQKAGNHLSAQNTYSSKPAQGRTIPSEPQDSAARRRPVQKRSPERIEIIAIGISTGGPNALRTVFPKLDKTFKVPILVVQHMPVGFTEEFANSLDKICPLEVKEAKDGDLIKPGRILIAPGNNHMTIVNKALSKVVRLSNSNPVNGHRPSADVLFKSVLEIYSHNCLALIMTGMGKDGAREIGKIYKEGGLTLAQDEKSCVVFGMPRAAIENEGISQVLPLDKIADTINELVSKYA